MKPSALNHKLLVDCSVRAALKFAALNTTFVFIYDDDDDDDDDADITIARKLKSMAALCVMAFIQHNFENLEVIV